LKISVNTFEYQDDIHTNYCVRMSLYVGTVSTRLCLLHPLREGRHLPVMDFLFRFLTWEV